MSQPMMEEPLRDELRALVEKNPGKWFNVSYRLKFHNGHFYFDALSATASDCPNADPLVNHLQQQVEKLMDDLIDDQREIVHLEKKVERLQALLAPCKHSILDNITVSDNDESYICRDCMAIITKALADDTR